MSLPTDVPREIADRAPQPGFDTVLDRARAGRRRRRTSIAAGLATAVVVAGAGFALGERPGGDASPEPANPAQTDDGAAARIDPELPEGVRHLLGGEDVHTLHVSAVDGSVAAFWLSCDKSFDPCRFAWTLRTGDEVAGGLVDVESRSVTTVPGGWLVDGQQAGSFLLSPDGDLEPVVTAAGGDALQPGDTAVLTAEGSRLLREGNLVAMPEPPGRPAVAFAHVTPSGRLVAATSDLDGWGVQATDDGRTWERLRPAPPGTFATPLVAGAGDHVTVVFSEAASDRSLPVLEVLVSSDAGRTWTTVDGLDTRGADRVRDPHSLVVAPGGTTYLTTVTDGLIRIDSDGDAQPAALSSSDTSVFTTDDEVCVQVEAGAVGELRCSSDDGATWSDPQPLPGFR
jgi:hypothetical protein